MSIELPPLRRYELCLRGYENTMKRDADGEYCWDEDREARERILLARIAANDNALSWIGELLAVMHADGGHYLAKHGMEKAIGDAMDKYHAIHQRIAELEAVLAKFDERWLMDGELGFCTACGVSIEGGESHKPECWLSEARAAIDAARQADAVTNPKTAFSSGKEA